MAAFCEGVGRGGLGEKRRRKLVIKITKAKRRLNISLGNIIYLRKIGG